MNPISNTSVRYFAEVVRTGSIRAAAENLFVAPSAISRQIGLIEEALGAPLLERRQGRGRVKLTAAGELVMRYYGTLRSESRRLYSEIESLRGLKKGEVRFGMPESLVRDVMPRFFSDFSQRYPGITFFVQVAGSPQLVERLLTDELDACFTFGDVPTNELDVLHSRQLPLYVLVPTGHPLQGRPALRLADCADYGLSLLDATLWAKKQYDQMLAQAKVRPRTVLETNSYELMRNVAAEGMCLAFTTVPIEDPAAKPRAGTYIPLRDPRAPPQRFALNVHKGRNLPPAALTFLSELTRRLVALEELAQASAAALALPDAATTKSSSKSAPTSPK